MSLRVIDFFWFAGGDGHLNGKIWKAIPLFVIIFGENEMLRFFRAVKHQQ